MVRRLDYHRRSQSTAWTSEMYPNDVRENHARPWNFSAATGTFTLEDDLSKSSFNRVIQFSAPGIDQQGDSGYTLGRPCQIAIPQTVWPLLPGFETQHRDTAVCSSIPVRLVDRVSCGRDSVRSVSPRFAGLTSPDGGCDQVTWPRRPGAIASRHVGPLPHLPFRRSRSVDGRILRQFCHSAQC